MRRAGYWFLVVLGLFLTGCQSRSMERTDRNVYQLIDARQRAALGTTSDARVDDVPSEPSPDDRIYSYRPHPVKSEVAVSFAVPLLERSRAKTEAADAATGPEEEKSTGMAEISASIYGDSELADVVVLGLQEVLTYAMRHSRDLQDAKVDLYLAALDLTLERHLWTPQLVAGLQASWEDPSDDSAFDRAMSAVSDASVTQDLPFGGSVSAKVVHSLVREVQDLVSQGESGQVILEARIPLLRGAGRAAYESRYAAERELVYAVRTFERFRRSLLVDVAADYFDLQQLKAAIENTYKSYLSRRQDSEKTDFEHAMGRRDIFEASRAKTILRDAEASLISAKELYESALDRFKVRMGMPVDSPLDVISQDQDEDSKALDAMYPHVDEATAIEVALGYRLDLLNSADGVDDARRGLYVARNRILPDLEVTGSVTLDSYADHQSATSFNEERTAWRGGVQLSFDDRKRERNAHRGAIISVRRAERNHQRYVDTVRTDVRRARRRVAQQENLRTIQELKVNENELRLEAARAQFDLGRRTNQDVIDAENDLLTARNSYAAAVAAYRIAILDFRLDTGTLRVSDDGRWEVPVAPADADADSQVPVNQGG